MSGYATPVGIIQDALASAIGAQALPSGAPVPTVGYPVGGPQRTHVWVAGSADIAVADEVTGYEQRDEEIMLEVFARAVVTGTSYADARAICLSLVGAVEAALAADRTLGQLAQHAAVVSLQLREAIPSERERECGAQILVAVTASATAS